LLLLFTLKLAATSLTLGWGAAGGVFSPALFTGATLGGVYGLVLGRLVPGLGDGAPAFAVAGMAGVVGGSTGAAMAAIVMIFEMTLDYNVVLPMTITVAVSYGVRRWLMRETIYTMKLVRRGLLLPTALQTDVHLAPRARDIQDTAVLAVPVAEGAAGLQRMLEENPDTRWFVTERDGRVEAILCRHDAIAALDREPQDERLQARLRRDFVFVPARARLSEVIPRMRRSQAGIALVTQSGTSGWVQEVRGVISRERIAEVMMDATEIFN